MQPGSFYLYSPRSSVPNWLPSFVRSRSEKSVYEKLDAVLNSPPAHPQVRSSSSADTATSPRLRKRASLLQTQTYVLPGGGITLRHGFYEIAADLYRVNPYVCSVGNAIIVFYGYLSNLTDLAKRLSAKLGSGFAGVGSLGGYSASSQSSQQYPDLGTLTASVVLHLYLEDSSSGNELLLLSELQGQFAFALYDSSHKQVFAARDPSGRESLSFIVDDDGGVHVTNNPKSLPPSQAKQDWLQIPPGHYVCGRPAKLHQFALTPEQLYYRELQTDGSFSEDDASLLDPPALRSPGNRQHGSIEEEDLFGLEM